MVTPEPRRTIFALDRLRSLLREPDVQANPVAAMRRRLRWKLHWRLLPRHTFRVRHWHGGLSLELPRTGAAAQVYYREFSSPQLGDLLHVVLGPGMCAIDVGAHVGEYALTAAALVGPTGRVYAIEPQRALLKVIETNARRNGLQNIEVHNVALGDREALVRLGSDDATGGAWLLPEQAEGELVECTTMDRFMETHDIAVCDFLKIDAAGAENAVLAGSRRAMSRGGLPRIAYKLYGPQVVRDRFQRDTFDTFYHLMRNDYKQWLLHPQMMDAPDVSRLRQILGPSWYSVPVLAVRSDIADEELRIDGNRT